LNLEFISFFLTFTIIDIAITLHHERYTVLMHLDTTISLYYAGLPVLTGAPS